MECLVLGCSGSGKSTLLNRLGSDSCSLPLPVLHPTVGTNVEDIFLNKRKCIRLREVSGSLRQTWSQYYSQCKVVIFLVDMANTTQLSTAHVELLKALSSPALQQLPVLLLFNKKLSPLALSLTRVYNIFGLDSVLQHTQASVKVLETDLSLPSSTDQISSWIREKYGVR